MTHSIDAPFPPTTTTGATSGATSVGGSPSTTDVAKDEARNVGQTAAQAGGQVASTAADQAKEVVQETRRQAQDLLDQGRSQVRDQAVTQQQKAAQGLSSLAEELRGMVNGTGFTTSGPAHDLLHQATDKVEELAGWLQNREPADLLAQGRSQLRDQAVTQQQKAADGLSSLAQQLRGMADGTSDGAPGPARDLLEQASGKVEEFSTWLQNREPADLLDEVRRFARRKPGMFLLGAAAAGVLAGRMTSGVKAVHTGNSGESGGRNVGGRYSGGTNYVDPAPAYGYETTTGTTGGTYGTGGTYTETTYAETTGTGTPLPPPPYGTVPPAGSVVPPTTPAGWDDPAAGTGEVR